ncbi:MAG TPA: helix-turn-helix domain-containing protein [Longimicrobium sp.]|jgi:transcriptional regulator with XRE-family HTH domain
MNAKPFAPQLHYIEEAHEKLGLTYAQIASALGTDESTLNRWRTGESQPDAAHISRIEELHEFQIELLDAIYPYAARDWLTREVPSLGGRRPIDLLVAGDIAPLTRIWLRINLGMPT